MSIGKRSELKERELMEDMVFTLFLIVAVASDCIKYKISNMILLAGAALCPIIKYAGAEDLNAVNMISGALIPFLICFPLFCLSMIGAGDIKLLMVTGLYVGRGVITVMISALIIAAVIAVIKLIRRRMISERLSYFLGYINELKMYLSGGKRISRNDISYIKPEDKAGRAGYLMHLSLPIAIAAILKIYVI